MGIRTLLTIAVLGHHTLYAVEKNSHVAQQGGHAEEDIRGSLSDNQDPQFNLRGKDVILPKEGKNHIAHGLHWALGGGALGTFLGALVKWSWDRQYGDKKIPQSIVESLTILLEGLANETVPIAIWTPNFKAPIVIEEANLPMLLFGKSFGSKSNLPIEIKKFHSNLLTLTLELFGINLQKEESYSKFLIPENKNPLTNFTKYPAYIINKYGYTLLRLYGSFPLNNQNTSQTQEPLYVLMSPDFKFSNQTHLNNLLQYLEQFSQKNNFQFLKPTLSKVQERPIQG